MSKPEARRLPPEYEIDLPDADLAQDDEWCRVRVGENVETIRFHDYARIFQIPGLYEALFVERLECRSPATVVGLLTKQMRAAGESARGVSALDVGAGNGMVGEALRDAGFAPVVGVDILPEARDAALRDRPKVYADYVVADLTRLTGGQTERLTRHRPTALTTVAALGFGDMPAAAFAGAYNLVASPGWVGFNLKEAFLDARADQTGFSRLVRRMIDEGVLEVELEHRYRHRLSTSGKALHYVAIVGRKTGDVPGAWLDGLD